MPLRFRGEAPQSRHDCKTHSLPSIRESEAGNLRNWCDESVFIREKRMNDNEDTRFEKLLYGATHSPLSFDLLEALSRNMDASSLDILVGNASMLPQYIKSKDIPYLSRSFKAP